MLAIRPRSHLGIVLAGLSALALVLAGPAAAHGGGKGANVYKKRNLVSDIAGRRAHHRPQPGQPVGPVRRTDHARSGWPDNGADVATLYTGRRATRDPGDRSGWWCRSRAGRPPGRSSTPASGFVSATARPPRASSSTPRPARSPPGARARADVAGDGGDHARRDLQGPGDRHGKGTARLLYAANFHDGHDRRLRRRLQARCTLPGAFDRPEPARRLRAVQHPGHRRTPVRRATPSRTPTPRTRSPAPGLGYVDVYDTSGQPAEATGLAGRPERAVGPGDGAEGLRPLQRRPARRQLRRRRRSTPTTRERAAPRARSRTRRQPDRHRRPVGPALRQRRHRHADDAALHGRHRRRGPRPLRRDRRARERR